MDDRRVDSSFAEFSTNRKLFRLTQLAAAEFSLCLSHFL
jgi:hypothetical protein